ncbi:MAG: lamin tail domain-containing protein [Patescibacteria group bacterium]
MRNSLRILVLFSVIYAILFPFFADASLRVTEIMYDLPTPGSDEKREWVEIYNDGGEAIDVSLWKFFENKTNHKLILFEGSPTISSGAFAIIASDPATFKKEWPAFSGDLFNSSFSLSNDGESISFVSSSTTEVTTTSYTSSLGAKGDGDSLQFFNGKWIANLPTPGSPTSLPPPPTYPQVVPSKEPVIVSTPPIKKISEEVPDIPATPNRQIQEFDSMSVSSATPATVIVARDGGDDRLSFTLFILATIIALPIGLLLFSKKDQQKKTNITIIE